MFEIDKQKFGAFVAELRREKGYTQKELVQQLFLSDKAVSKWETGASLPDTALLIPLAERLGVSVTELLTCRRINQETPIDAGEVEDLIQTAITLSDEKSQRAYQTKTRWPLLYLCALLIGGASTLFCYLHQLLGSTTCTVLLLGTLFGGYFCLAVRTRLPAFYDENRCGFYYDGPFRMNVPGLAFTNANWPYIVRVGRIWCCCIIALYPLANLILAAIHATFWREYELYIALASMLGGLFIPLYLVGRKYQ